MKKCNLYHHYHVENLCDLPHDWVLVDKEFEPLFSIHYTNEDYPLEFHNIYRFNAEAIDDDYIIVPAHEFWANIRQENLLTCSQP